MEDKKNGGKTDRLIFWIPYMKTLSLRVKLKTAQPPLSQLKQHPIMFKAERLRPTI